MHRSSVHPQTRLGADPRVCFAHLPVIPATHTQPPTADNRALWSTPAALAVPPYGSQVLRDDGRSATMRSIDTGRYGG